jgi:DNA-binding transcriptional LysR family regulator
MEPGMDSPLKRREAGTDECCHRQLPRLQENVHISLNDWRILHAVHYYGSFVAAAEHIHMTQSAVSYRISKIERQLGMRVCELGGRRAVLTDVGRKILERSRYLLDQAVELETYMKELAVESRASARDHEESLLHRRCRGSA